MGGGTNKFDAAVKENHGGAQRSKKAVTSKELKGKNYWGL